MKFAAYHQAAHPEPRLVLGRLLQPYALGHVELLHACESAFILDTETPEITWEDLALAVLICSGTWEEGKALLWNIRSNPKVALRHTRACFKWGRKLTDPDITAAGLAFVEYLRAGSQTINIRYPEPKGDAVNEAPRHQMVKCHFLFNSCLTESQIMNRPWGLALSEWMTHLALQGLVTTLDDEPTDEQRILEARAAAMPVVSDAPDIWSAAEIIRKSLVAEREAAERAESEKGGFPA